MLTRLLVQLHIDLLLAIVPFLGGSCISWTSKKQATVSRSSSEVEYRALASIAAELTWISFILRDIEVHLSNTPTLYCDNISALHMTVNPVFHGCTKHVEIDYHFVWEKVSPENLVTQYILSDCQITDIFTKALPRQSLEFLCSKLGFSPALARV